MGSIIAVHLVLRLYFLAKESTALICLLEVMYSYVASFGLWNVCRSDMCHFQEEAFITSVMEAWADKEVPLHQNSLESRPTHKEKQASKDFMWARIKLNSIWGFTFLFFFFTWSSTL